MDSSRQRRHAYRAWIFVLPFGTAAGLCAYSVLPLFRASATLSTYRTKILGFPLFWLDLPSSEIGVRITALFSALFHAPLVQAREATDRIAQGDYDEELTVHSNDELGVLGERINGMASSLKSHSEQIRRLGTEIEQTQKEVVFTMGAIGERPRDDADIRTDGFRQPLE